uniref:Putative nucleoprotein n=1 Tax=Panonychus citri mivirus TaxID=2760845 RepID=A0A7G4YW62_9VIRU|nr:putative nucleoprotein [Panonychus citri mivirus]
MPVVAYDPTTPETRINMSNLLTNVFPVHKIEDKKSFYYKINFMKNVHYHFVKLVISLNDFLVINNGPGDSVQFFETCKTMIERCVHQWYGIDLLDQSSLESIDANAKKVEANITKMYLKHPTYTPLDLDSIDINNLTAEIVERVNLSCRFVHDIEINPAVEKYIAECEKAFPKSPNTSNESIPENSSTINISMSENQPDQILNPITTNTSVKRSLAEDDQPSTRSRNDDGPMPSTSANPPPQPQPSNDEPMEPVPVPSAPGGGPADPDDPENQLGPNEEPLNKLDSYRTYMLWFGSQSVELRLFGNLFTRNLTSVYLPDFANPTYRDRETSIMVLLMVKGKIAMLAPGQLTSPTYHFALSAAEILMPNVPHATYMDNHYSRQNAYRYICKLFGASNPADLPGIVEFLDSIFSVAQPDTASKVLYKQVMNGVNVRSTADFRAHHETNEEYQQQDGVADVPDNVIECKFRMLYEYITSPIALTSGGFTKMYKNFMANSLIAVAKRGSCSSKLAEKYLNDLTATDPQTYAFTPSDLTKFHDYVKDFIDENTAKLFFQRVSSYVQNIGSVVFRNMLRYTMYSGLSGMMIIATAIRLVPNFFWPEIRAKYPIQFTVYDSVCEIFLPRPYAGFIKTGIPTEYGLKRYREVIYCAICVLTTFGGMEYSTLKDYQGIRKSMVSEEDKRFIADLIERYRNQVLPENNINKATKEQRKVDIMTSGLDTYKNSFALAKLAGDLEDMRNLANLDALIERAKQFGVEEKNKFFESGVLEVRDPKNVPQQSYPRYIPGHESLFQGN